MPSIFDKLKREHRRDKSPKPDGAPAIIQSGEPAAESATSLTDHSKERQGTSQAQVPVKRYGLSEVGQCAPSDKMDVVLVHGLMGHPYDTWVNKETNFYWPAHVTKDIADVRIMAFGYDANPSSFMGKVGQNRLGEHALDLLSELARKREKTDTESRPIVWVAHSLGGLVVEKALTVGDTCSDFQKHLQDIAHNTKGIITLGTPHAGSDIAAWADIAGRLLRGVHVNQDLIKTLTTDSEVLRDTNASFGRFLESRKDRSLRVEIQPFHETLPISNVGMVVSIASASIFGHPSESMQGNHMDMTKFSSRDDNNYEKLTGTVRRWIKSLQAPIDQAAAIELKGSVACLKSLHYPGLQQLGNPHSPAYPGTFDWIFAEDTVDKIGFAGWLRDPQGPYWIQGNPGSGKTTMVCHIINNANLHRILTNSSKDVLAVAVHYFQATATGMARSISGMLRSLLWILGQRFSASAVDVLVKRHKRLSDTTYKVDWSAFELEAALKDLAGVLSDLPMCLFVDGLDEYDGEDKEIANYLDTLSRNLPNNVRLCLSSRPYPDFNANFRGSKGFKMHKHTNLDIATYVCGRFAQSQTMPPHQVQSLIHAITAKAQGLFFWVQLVCDDLRDHWIRHKSFQTLRERLDDMPDQLESFYHRIIDGLGKLDREDFFNSMSLATSDMKPLDLLSYWYAQRYQVNLEILQAEHSGNQSFDKKILTDDWFVPHDVGGRHDIASIGHAHATLSRFEKQYKEQVELTGRGLLIVEETSGFRGGSNVKVSHETVLNFWSRLSDGVRGSSVERTHELLLVAWAAYLVTTYSFSNGGRADDCVYLKHFFGCHVADWDSRFHPLTYHAFQLHKLQSDPRFILQCLPKSALRMWLGLEKPGTSLQPVHRRWQWEAHIEGESYNFILLCFLIHAGCHHTARFVVAQVNEQEQLRGSEINSPETAIQRPVSSDWNFQPCIDVNQVDGHLLLLAAGHHSGTSLHFLFNLGARVRTGLPLASTCLHRAIRLNNVTFVREFLHLFCDDTSPIAVLQTPLYSNPATLKRVLTDRGSDDVISPGDDGFSFRSAFDRTAERVSSVTCRDRWTVRHHRDDQFMMSPLAFASAKGNIGVLEILLSYYPRWEIFLGFRACALTEAVKHNQQRSIETLERHKQSELSSTWCFTEPVELDDFEYMKEQRHLGLMAAAGYKYWDTTDALQVLNISSKTPLSAREHSHLQLVSRYRAMMMAVQYGHCEVLRELLCGASGSPNISTEVLVTDGRRIQLLKANISLTPLHFALAGFRLRSHNVAQRIVQVLADGGAILCVQVKDVLPELVEMGRLNDEDYTWLLRLFPADVVGLPDVVIPQITALEPQFIWQGDSDSGQALSDFDSSSTEVSQSDSQDSFVSARES